jgi:predicted unusual protein kinase regulating ubiquinone biosynthesis (AarF/ABC1/UbiB family)
MRFVFLALTVSFSLASLAESLGNSNQGQMLGFVNQFISEAKQAESFRIYGEEKLLLKLIMREILLNKNLDIKNIQPQYEQLKSQLVYTKKKFSSMQEYVDFEKDSWPESGDVATDLKRIQDVGMTIVEPEFENDLDKEIFEKESKNKKDFLNKMGLSASLMFLKLGQSKQGTSENVMAQIQESALKFNDLDKKLVDSFREMFSSDGDGFIKAAFPILLSEYLENSTPRMKLNMLSAMLDESFPYSKIDFIESIFSNSGPQFQKMVQLLARNKGIDKNWKTLFESFENSVRPVPYWQVEELLKKTTFPFEVLEFEKEPLGVGTIAQVHAGKVRMKDGRIEEVIFRFIKPGTNDRAQEELDIINKACLTLDEHEDIKGKGFPKLAKIAGNAFLMIVDDMKLKIATRNQLKAIKVYSRKDVVVPNIWLSLEEDPLFMIQTRAEGKKLSKYSLYVRKKVINRIVQFWLEEAMFGSGYFHADLHQGNFMVKLRKKFAGNERELKALLDYGMFGKLNKSDRTNLMGLGIALKAKNVKSITNIAWNLSNHEETEITKSQLIKEIAKKFGDESASENVSVEDLLKYFSEIKLELNQNVLQFLRGSVALSGQLSEVDKKNTFISNAIRVALKHPVQVLKVLKLEDITPRDMFKVAWKELFKKPEPMITAQKSLRQCLGHY